LLLNVFFLAVPFISSPSLITAFLGFVPPVSIRPVPAAAFVEVLAANLAQTFAVFAAKRFYRIFQYYLLPYIIGQVQVVFP
jgi:hypothetical protein